MYANKRKGPNSGPAEKVGGTQGSEEVGEANPENENERYIYEN